MTNILSIAVNANTSKLIELGAQIRAQRKALRINAISAAVGYPTLRLIRFAIGEWNLEKLPPGQWRETNA
jgi:16S rRNA U516 pseudouridylate synthase RsuA-like enzyme